MTEPRERAILQFAIIDTGSEFKTVINGVSQLVTEHGEAIKALSDIIVASMYCKNDNCEACKKCVSEAAEKWDAKIQDPENHSSDCTCTYCINGHAPDCTCHICKMENNLKKLVH